MNRRSILLAAVVVAAGQTAAVAQGTIMVMNPVVRPPVVADLKVGALYMVLMNHGSDTDKLTAISTPVAEMVELHETKEENGVVSMNAVPSLEIAAGGMIELKTGGLHAMVMGIKSEIKAGDSVPFTLTFEKAGKVELVAKVEPVTN